MTLAAGVDQKMYASDLGGPSMGKFKKRAAENITFAVDYSVWLDPDDTIAVLPSFAITPPSVELPFGTFPNLSCNPSEISADGKEIMFQVGAGQNGVKYEIVVSVQTATGQVKQDYFTITVGHPVPASNVSAMWYIPLPLATESSLGGVMAFTATAKKFVTGLAENGNWLFRQPTYDDIAGGGGWNTSHPVLGTYHIWIDAAGKLRIKNGTPTGDTDGAVVGSQA